MRQPVDDLPGCAESTVIEGLRKRLMDPALFKVFAHEFATEWNWLQADAEARLGAAGGEMERICRQIDRLVDAWADRASAARATEKLRELEGRRLELEGVLASTASPAPRLHPNLAEVYRCEVEKLHNALKSEDAGPARELVRSLIEDIVLRPENGRLRVEVRGELAAILRLSGLNEKGQGSSEHLAQQIKMVAGLATILICCSPDKKFS